MRAPPLYSLVIRLSLVVGLLAGTLSCNQAPASTTNPATLWVGFGQTEVDLVLVETPPPYY
jgi:hypothetical protein